MLDSKLCKVTAIIRIHVIDWWIDWLIDDYIEYIIMEDLNHITIHGAHALHIIFDEVNWYIGGSNGNKYLIFTSTDKNKEVSTKYIELCNRIKNLIEKINGKPGEYKRVFVKTIFDSNDNLSLEKILKLHNQTIVARSVFQKDDKRYPQIF